MGAMALFGEKYGDLVRVIKFGDSIELCGGIHVQSTANIGQFKLVSESAIAAGVRRIEAISGTAADAHIRAEEITLKELKQLLKNDKNPVKALQDVLQNVSQLTKQLEEANRKQAGNIKEELLGKVRAVKGVNLLTEKVSLDPKSIKDIAFQLKNQVDNLFMVLAAEKDGKATITVAVSENLVADKELHAGNIVRELAKEIGGGGGGQPFFATAGGKNPAGISSALEKAESFL